MTGVADAIGLQTGGGAQALCQPLPDTIRAARLHRPGWHRSGRTDASRRSDDPQPFSPGASTRERFSRTGRARQTGQLRRVARPDDVTG
jgi:hypothetical protein